MKNQKFNNKKAILSKQKPIINPKSQKEITISSKKEKNKYIQKKIIPNVKNNQDKLKETKFQTENKSKSISLNKNQKNISKEGDKVIEKEILNGEKEEEKNINKQENDEKNIEKNSIILEEKEKENSFNLKLSREEINKLIDNSKPKLKKSISNDNNFKDDVNKLKNLTNKQKSLFNEIDKINLEKKYFNEYSFNNLSKNNKFHQNVQNDNIKNLEKNENYIIQKINLVNQEIININKNNYIDNNKEKEEKKIKDEINKKLKQFRDENSIIFKRIKDDAELNLEKRIKEFDKLEKEESERKRLELIRKNKEEKMLEKKREKKVNKEVIKNKPFINNNNIRGQKKNYLYFKMANSFDKNEEKLLKKQKKLKLKISDNINEENEKKRNDYLEKKRLEMIDNINNLHNMWKERNNLLPKYKSPLYEKILDSEENNKENERNKLELKKQLYYEKEKYCKEKIRLPPISNILRKKNEKKNNNLFYKNFTKRNKSSGADPTKINNNKFIQSYSINENKFLNSETTNEIINLKENKLIKSYSTSSIKNNNLLNIKKIGKNLNHKNIRNPNDFNYLEELKKERNCKKNEIKYLNFGKSNNLDFIRGKIQLMEEKYHRDKELLKVKGGYAHNQELGDNVNELLVNSIKTKLDIIENMSK